MKNENKHTFRELTMYMMYTINIRTSIQCKIFDNCSFYKYETFMSQI